MLATVRIKMYLSPAYQFIVIVPQAFREKNLKVFGLKNYTCSHPPTSVQVVKLKAWFARKVRKSICKSLCQTLFSI